MPGTNEEMVALATSDSLLPAGLRWADGTMLTERDRDNVMALRVYAIRMRKVEQRSGRPQRRAHALVRSLLSAEQRAELRRTGSVVLTLASGHSYRITPRFGHVERVTRHGSRWFAHERFCIHDEQDDDAMPPADLSVSHMLMLLADEDGFLATANARTARDQLWNREYLRRFRRYTA